MLRKIKIDILFNNYINIMKYIEQFDSFWLEVWRHNRRTFNRKSWIVWWNKWNISWVILYLSKPRNMKQEDFENVLDNIQISFNR
jgi:hypothetical protein